MSTQLIILIGPDGIGKKHIARFVSKINKEKQYAIVSKSALLQFLSNDSSESEVYKKNRLSIIKNFLDSDISVFYTDDILKEDLEQIKQYFKNYKVIVKIMVCDHKTITLRNLTKQNYNFEKAFEKLERYKKDFNKDELTDTSGKDLHVVAQDLAAELIK